jgi:hypothetical protein
MRADIHDGPEHMLQSETEYIDARPHQPASTKASCTARPDHTFGSKGEILAASRCFPPYPQNRTSLNAVGMSETCPIPDIPLAA